MFEVARTLHSHASVCAHVSRLSSTESFHLDSGPPTRTYAEDVIRYMFELCGVHNDWKKHVRVVFTREDMRPNSGVTMSRTSVQHGRCWAWIIFSFLTTVLCIVRLSRTADTCSGSAVSVDVHNATNDTFLPSVVCVQEKLPTLFKPRAVYASSTNGLGPSDPRASEPTEQ